MTRHWTMKLVRLSTQALPTELRRLLAPAFKSGSEALVTISRAAFRARFASHVTQALVAHGIDAPERLLFMSEAEIHNIPGVGKGAVAEIKLYRDRFLPRSAFVSR
jgi:hypothetical protein